MAAATSGWTPHSSLTQAPTNLKEAIDWVLRVTGKDGKKNQKNPAKPDEFSCLCFLAKAVKDLLYDAKDPGTPGSSSGRYWDDILLKEERDIVKPVLEDLGLVSSGSTSAASTTCAGGTEVIKALIDQLALGLQKWVGWQDGDKDVCCLKGENGIGKECKCTGTGGAAGCCNTGSSSGCTCATSGQKCSYKSAYDKQNALWTTIVNGTTGAGGSGSAGSAVGGKGGSGVTLDPVKAAQDVHLLARIFLGSVCLIWSGLSQLGFLTGGSGRWSQDGKLHEVDNGLGSFMAAMGYDLERLNGESGYHVWKILTGKNRKNNIQWQEFASVKDKTGGSVAEYYSSIYGNAKTAAGKSTTESICKQYPLLVLHILASGYFRAGSAGANKVTPPKAAPTTPKTTTPETTKKDDKPRHPRTIREILYWLSALPYSQGYKDLVDRMQQKTEQVANKQDSLKLEGDGANNRTDLKKDCVTHYLMAACGYCPLVLIGIQGTIATSGNDSAPAAGSSGSAAAKNRCPEHSKDPKSKRCTTEVASKTTENSQQQSTKICYGGYHLAVKDFGPLHGMYANGLYGFDMGGSPAQCLDQLRIYVYHCFYQLYFLRKQCTVGVEKGTALGWKSCRYGSGVYMGSGYSNSHLWKCKTEGNGDHTQKCGIPSSAGSGSNTNSNLSPLMCFLCDGIGSMACGMTIGTTKSYPDIEEHMTSEFSATGHFGGPPKHCPVPMGWQAESGGVGKENHFKDLNNGSHKQANLEKGKYPAHCTGNTLSYLLEYYCDPVKCHGTLVVLLRLLACITPTVPRTLGDLFGFYYYIVYIGGKNSGGQGVYDKLGDLEKEVLLHRGQGNAVVTALTGWNSGDCKTGNEKNLKCLVDCTKDTGAKYLSPLSGQQYGQLSPVMAGTYLSWLVYLIGEFKDGLQSLEKAFRDISCTEAECKSGAAGVAGCGDQCRKGNHGETCTGGGSAGVCGCPSVVSCTGVLPVLYKYGFGYGNVETLHKTPGAKKCHHFLETLNKVEGSTEFSQLTNSINQLIYTTRLPWIFVLTVAWLVAVLYLAFGAIWPLDWTHMRSHCRGWFRKGSLSPWEILMVGKKKGRGILEFFGKEGKDVVGSTTGGYRWVKWLMVIIGTVAVFAGPLVAALVKNNDAWKIPLAVLLGIGGGALLVGVMVKAVAT